MILEHYRLKKRYNDQINNPSQKMSEAMPIIFLSAMFESGGTLNIRFRLAMMSVTTAAMAIRNLNLFFSPFDSPILFFALFLSFSSINRS